MTDSIKVAVRVRPFNQKEIDEGSRNIVEMDGQTVRLKNPDTGELKPFGFHRCYWSTDDSLGKPPVNNTFVFNDIGKEILDHIYQGYNSTVFAYGQTGSGKSYSIEGYEEKGLLQMCLEDIFKRRKPENDAKGIVTTVKITYLEIYNEKLRDLVNPRENADIKVHQAGTAIFINGVDPVLCESYEEVEKIFKDGKKVRVIGAHAMNKNSSRSHAVFTIFYKEVGGGKMQEAKFNIVDLAGSERQSKTFATGVRLEEANNINKSLTSLGLVIEALAKNCQKKVKDFVPYRNSLLTHILSESLCGNSKTFMIAAISPAHTNYEESISTLRFAQRASLITTNSKKNLEAKEGYNKELMAEIERLKKELEAARGKQIYVHNVEFITIEEQNRMNGDEQKKQEDLMNRLAIIQGELDRNKQDKVNLQKNLEEERRRKAEMDENRGKCIGDTKFDDKLPYIMNISEDPTLAGMLTYNLKEGETTVGTNQSDSIIKLNALGIMTKHCSIFFVKGEIFIEPKPEAKLVVNGLITTKKTKLDHLDRITLGHGNTFKLVIPGRQIKDDLRQSLSFGSIYGEFLDDRMSSNTPQAKSLKQFLMELDHRLQKSLFSKFVEKFKSFYEDIEEANGYTFERYRKFPLNNKNLNFRINAVIDIDNYMKGVPELVILCESKETKELQFIWSEEKFQRRFADMQSWWSDSKGKQAESSFYEFDPWFDATDLFIKEKETMEVMKNKDLFIYWNNKISAIVANHKKLLEEQKEILKKLQSKGYSEDLAEDYADHYFRGWEAKQSSLKKLQEMRAQDNIHRTAQRFMECCAEVQKCNMDHKMFLEQRERYAAGSKKNKESSGEQAELLKENIMLFQRIEDLTQELRKRTKEKKREGN